MNRRGFLRVGAALALAGCSGTSDGGDDGTATSPASASPTAAAETLDTHPAAADLADQPTLGPDPREATGVIVAFEDPSCPTCRRFEENVVPQLREELIDPGTVSYVFRTYPVIYPWGEPATRALEAVYDHDAAAHWTLLEHFFANQGSFRGSEPATVYDETETFLANETDIDATAVVEAARNGEYDAAVQADLDAGDEAGAGGRTPHLFFFRDGVYRTKSGGFTGMTTITEALGV